MRLLVHAHLPDQLILRVGIEVQLDPMVETGIGIASVHPFALLLQVAKGLNHLRSMMIYQKHDRS